MYRTLAFRLISALTFGAAFLSTQALAQTPSRHSLITQKIDDNNRRTLEGNTRPQANAENDRGRVPDDFAMEHMLLQLKRSPQQEQALQTVIDQLHDPKSPSFHQWMTPAEFGQSYGASQQDISAIKTWIESHGFTVNSVYPNGMTIDFSGTAGQVRSTFHTEIHYLDVNGERHVANMSDPQIPEALADVLTGVVSLHDFSPRPMKKAHTNYTFMSGGSTYQALVPGDLAAIYNLNPLFAAGITGKGQTIAVIEDTDLYSTADWNTFRSTFGLSQYASGSLTTVQPAPATGVSNCRSPGVNSDDSEAIIDVEWASAAAPNAAIEVASCANTRTTWGGLIAIQNLINNANPPSIISVSYGNCEAENGASVNAAFSSTYQQAVAEGISVFVSAGDEGAASCDAGATAATHGIGVSGFASTPYNVAVGGTDFGDSVAGTNSQYWTTTNSATYESALSYVPEIPWNDSCASSLLAGFFDFTITYGTSGFCGSSTASKDQFLGVVAGSGGPSGCASGAPSTSGVVSGTCKGFAKPSWQAGVAGIPQDGVRDMPDISIFAADGVWGHYYVTCFSDPRNGGSPCTGSPSNWAGAGGTSFGAPIMAGVQALINQKGNGPQGNPNYVYYKLAANAASVCNSLSGDTTVSPCIFHNVTKGDIDVNCGGTDNCFGAAAAATRGGRGGHGGSGEGASENGALSTSTTALAQAYGTATGWNFATGVGSINAYNLVMNWIF